MKNNISILLSKLNGNVPLYLLLGQSYQSIMTGSDLFLQEVIRKYNGSTEMLLSYDVIFNSTMKDNPEASLAWLQSRGERLSPPEPFSLISKVQWSGVYTTSIDNIWYRQFRREWRNIQPIFEEKYRPSDPRNRRKLHITYMFGCVDRMEESERPPLTKMQWLNRKQEAISLARRLPEYITPFGILLIEGYRGDLDWFKIEDLYPIIDSMGSDQVFIFSVDDELLKNEYFVSLIENKKIVIFKDSLYQILQESETSGKIRIDACPAEGDVCRQISVLQKNVHIPPNIYNQVSRTCTILDNNILKPVVPLSKDKEYLEYRNFLGEVSSNIIWEGYARKFAFERAFEAELYDKVKAKLESNKLQNEPIILAGQSGSGKSVALGALTYKILQERYHPVLYMDNNVKKPSNYDIDAFCQWVEDEVESHNTLLIWDGMVEVDQYFELTKFLFGRGRKVVLVGSTYWKDDSSFKQRYVVKAPGFLTANEKKRFIQYLNSFQEPLGDLFTNYLKTDDNYFLVALYRILPTTRSKIQTGLVKELNYSELELEKKINIDSQEFANSLGYALLKANILSQSQLGSTSKKTIGDEEYTESRSILNLIMVPGKFGLKIPLEIILRVIKKKNYIDLVRIINSLDIVRWHEDNRGNIFLSPRTSLEAKLISYAEMGGAKTEIGFVTKLLSEIKAYDDSSDNIEIDFAVELLKNVGPNGPSPYYYSPFYVDISKALTELREERGVINSRLMLQEATLLREAVAAAAKEHQPIEGSIELIRKAENILTEIMNKTLDEQKSSKQVYMVERAAVLATKLRYLIDIENNYENVDKIYSDIIKTIWKAHSYEEEYYPLDIIAWVGPYLLKFDFISTVLRETIKADILYAFDLADSDELSSAQNERLTQRKVTAYSALGENELSETAFKQLHEQGSCVGYYLKAHEIAGELPSDRHLTSDQCERCSAAFKYLEKEYDYIKNDEKTLYFFLKLLWMKKTGQPFFYRERQTIPFRQEDWEYLVKILIELKHHPGIELSPTINYLYGLAQFHLGRMDEAFAVFKELERASDYLTGRRRLIRAHLASMPDGQPRKYSGEVAWVRPDNSKGEIYIPELRRKIPFSPRDFGRLDIKKNETLGEFHLAFNFRGPIVDPMGRVK